MIDISIDDFLYGLLAGVIVLAALFVLVTRSDDGPIDPTGGAA